MKKVKIVILGAGVTGLFAADALLDNGEKSILVLEKNSFAGGIGTSFKKNGFTIDYGPHKLFSMIPGVMDKFKKINGPDNLVVKKTNSLVILDKKFQFPIKPVEVIKNISLKTALAGILIPLSFLKSIVIYDLLGKKADSFEDYLVKGFGRKAYNILFKGYALKVWANPVNLSKDIAEIRIPVPTISGLIKSLRSKELVKVNASEFYYPKRGMMNFVENLTAMIHNKGGNILINQEIMSINKKNDNFIIKTNHETYVCENLISTIPIAILIKLYAKSYNKFRDTANALKYNDLSLVYLFVNKPRVLKENWIFFPGIKYSFNRVSEQKTFSQYTCPYDKTVLCAEVTNPIINRLPKEELVKRVISDLIGAGIISDSKEITDTHYIRLDKIYPIYDLNYKQHLKELLNFLDGESIITLGRFGLFKYNNIDHCLDMAEKCAKWITSKEPISQWKLIRESFNGHRIVD